MQRNMKSDRIYLFVCIVNVNRSYVMFPLERVTVQKVFTPWETNTQTCIRSEQLWVT